MGVLFQILCTVIICTMGINMGLIFAWPAATITMFASENTTLNRPMIDTEISLLGSLSSVGALLSTLTAGFMLDKFGRKKCSIIVALSLTIFWVLLIVAKNVVVVLISVFISGISSSAYLIATVYIGEICQESIRGAMTSANVVSYSLGMLLSYCLGGYLEYDIMLYVGLSMTVGGACSLFLLKDSPVYLLQNGREKEAAQAIAYFRRLKPSDKEVTDEINNLKRSLNPDLDDSTPEHEQLKPDLKPAEKLSCWQFIKKSKSTRRALVLSFMIVTASIFQGFIVVQMYVEPLFMEILPTVSPTACSVAMAGIGAVAGVVAAYLTDVAGRRPLMIYASFAACISCVILGTQMDLHWGPNWLTAAAAYFFGISYMCGGGVVPYVLIAEVFLPEVKSLMSMLLIEWFWLCNFILLFIVNPMLNALGWGPMFYIFSGVSFFTAVYCIFFLPETKGMTVEEIQLLFVKKSKRNHC